MGEESHTGEIKLRTSRSLDKNRTNCAYLDFGLKGLSLISEP